MNDLYGKFTKCELGIGFKAENKEKIENESFCFNPKTIIKDDLGMIKYGRLIVPATGDYKLTAVGEIYAVNVNQHADFGFDLMNDSNTGNLGFYEQYAKITLRGNDINNTLGIVTDVLHLTEGQIIGCIYIKGKENVRVYKPTLTIERLA